MTERIKKEPSPELGGGKAVLELNRRAERSVLGMRGALRTVSTIRFMSSFHVGLTRSREKPTTIVAALRPSKAR